MAEAPGQSDGVNTPGNPGASASPAAAPDSRSSASDIALKVAGWAGTGLGILGFVTLFGGAIIWVRANEAQLPATEAVAVIPRSVLIATGATFLVPALLIALATLALAGMTYLVFRLRSLYQARSKWKEARQAAGETAAPARAAAEAEAAAQKAREKCVADLGPLIRMERESEDDTERKIFHDKWQRLLADEEDTEKKSEEAAAKAVEAREKAWQLTEAAEKQIAPSTTQRVVEIGIGGIALFLIPMLFNGAIWHVGALKALVVLLPLAILATGISVYVYYWTERFIWFGVVAFVTLGIYLGAATYFSTERNPKMQPVAALWTGHSPVTGAFIADTSSNLYVGTFDEPTRPPRLVVIPRAAVNQVEIGPLLDPNEAERRALAMAIEQCKQLVAVPVAATDEGDSAGAESAAPASNGQAAEPQYKEACEAEQVEDLRSALKLARAKS